MYTFCKQNYLELKGSKSYNSQARTPYFRTEWLDFIHQWRGYQPVVIEIKKDERRIGYFCGLEKQVGFWKMIGSPLPGCLGQTMGFSLENGTSEVQQALLDELLEYLHKVCKYSYITICDEKIGKDLINNSAKKLIYGTSYVTWFLDIDRPLEEIKKGFSKTYRNYINKFQKSGGEIQEDASDEFIAEHNRQLIDVYDRDGIPSPNIISKYKKLLEATKETDMVYCIRADMPEQKNIGSSIYVSAGEWAYFLTNASYSDWLNARPNQSLMYNAIGHMQSKGIKKMDLVGPCAYKGYYGAEAVKIPNLVYSPNKLFYIGISTVRKLYYASYRWRGALKKLIQKT